MSKRFRCGRLMLTKDGKIRKLDLGNGGGSRFCDWYHNDMGFDDVHSRLLNIFSLKDNKDNTSLYDFQLRPLDVNQYETFLEYMSKYGLNCNSTVIYICTREADQSRIMMKKKETLAMTTSSLSLSQQKTSVLIETSSSTTSLEHQNVIKNEPNSDPQQIHPSLSEYSFKDSSNDIMKNIRDLINANSFDGILIQLFEYICIIHGYVCSIIDPLNQQIEQSNEYFQAINQSEITLHSNSLNDVYGICKSIKTLFKLNKDRFGQMQQFSTIVNLFPQFYDNLKILRGQWFEGIENNNNNNNNNNRSHETSSSFIYSTESTTSRSSHSSIHPPPPPPNRFEANIHPPPPNHAVANINPLPPNHSEANKEIPYIENQDSSVLFQRLLQCSSNLISIMYTARLSTFRNMVISVVTKIKSVRSNLNLNDHKSVCEAIQAVDLLKVRYTRKFSSDTFSSRRYRITRLVKQEYKKTLRALCNLLKTLAKYRQQIEKKNPTNWSSTPLSITVQEQSTNRQEIHSNKRRFENSNGNNNGRTEIASYASGRGQHCPKRIQRSYEQPARISR